MREPWNWTKEDLEKLIGQAESVRLDFKQSRLLDESRERIAERLTREVSAFANTEGGVIVIGIAEEREGKARVASHIDDGVDVQTWPPERLQQLIESNISPYLTGLRIRPIALDKDRTRFAYVIYVPQGNTAYQARDHRYYGRFEYEARSLPDHEIRLRMFRGKAASAIVQVVDCQQRDTVVTFKDAKQRLSSQYENFIEDLGKLDPNEDFPLKQYKFDIIVKNLGEINITEFKLRLDFPTENYFKLTSYTRTAKDGWPQDFHPFQDGRPMCVNVYPQDTIYVRSYELYLRPTENLDEKGLALNWTLYLTDTLPVHGQINIAEEFERQNATDVRG